MESSSSHPKGFVKRPGLKSHNRNGSFQKSGHLMWTPNSRIPVRRTRKWDPLICGNSQMVVYSRKPQVSHAKASRLDSNEASSLLMAPKTSLSSLAKVKLPLPLPGTQIKVKTPHMKLHKAAESPKKESLGYAL